jgi:hypothetical protein
VDDRPRQILECVVSLRTDLFLVSSQYPLLITTSPRKIFSLSLFPKGALPQMLTTRANWIPWKLARRPAAAVAESTFAILSDHAGWVCKRLSPSAPRYIPCHPMSNNALTAVISRCMVHMIATSKTFRFLGLHQ